MLSNYDKAKILAMNLEDITSGIASVNEKLQILSGILLGMEDIIQDTETEATSKLQMLDGVLWEAKNLLEEACTQLY